MGSHGNLQVRLASPAQPAGRDCGLVRALKCVEKDTCCTLSLVLCSVLLVFETGSLYVALAVGTHHVQSVLIHRDPAHASCALGGKVCTSPPSLVIASSQPL